jgi:hypothetical protein
MKVMMTNHYNKGLISADRGTRPLSCLQYPVAYLSRLQRICLSQYLNLIRHRPNAPVMAARNRYHVMIWTAPRRHGLCVCIVTLGKLRITAYQHGFGLRGVQP